MIQTVLILGASGKIGTNAARAFARKGWEVRRFNRETDDMTEAARGCDVIVNGLNPPNYHDWARLIPEITRQVISAARASGATVILPGNVYIYGDTPGEWSECTEPNPCSRKGRIRLDMERAYAGSGVQTINLRAGNLVDPDHNGDILSLMLLTRIRRGRVVSPGDADAIQPWGYMPDWARAAVELAEKRAELSSYEDIPFPGHTFTVNDLRRGLEVELGRELRLASFPWWLIRLAAPVWELARELLEMRYLWNTPHTLSPRRFNALLPDFEPTPLREVFRAALPDDLRVREATAAQQPMIV